MDCEKIRWILTREGFVRLTSLRHQMRGIVMQTTDVLVYVFIDSEIGSEGLKLWCSGTSRGIDR